MMNTFITILFVLIVFLLIGLLIAVLLLIKSSTADLQLAPDSLKTTDPKHLGESKSSTELVFRMSELTDNRQAIAEAAVNYVLENHSTIGNHERPNLLQSPVSPWQAALRASTLHRRAVRR